jgi:hypothetical protein
MEGTGRGYYKTKQYTQRCAAMLIFDTLKAIIIQFRLVDEYKRAKLPSQ